MHLGENSEFHTVIKPDDYARQCPQNKTDIWKFVLEQGDKDRVTSAILVSALLQVTNSATMSHPSATGMPDLLTDVLS